MSVDHDEFAEFASACGRQLFRTAYLLAGDRHLAEDVTQTQLGKLYASWPRVRRADNVAAYARTVLVRTYVDQGRRAGREWVTDSVPDQAGLESDAALRVVLFDALRQLSVRDRAIVVLRFWEDRSVRETASSLGMREGAVRARSMRALSKLRVLLGSEAADLAER